MFNKIAFLFFALILQGCAGAIFGSTLVGAYFVGSFSGVSEVKSEYSLQQKISKELLAIKKLQENLSFDIEPLVLSEKIFLIGVAGDKSSKNYPMDFISSKYRKKFKIIDEVRVANINNLQKISDSIIKKKIKIKLIFTNRIRYGNYYIAVYGGEVIIVGSAGDKYESAKVFDLISSTRGVKKIINYVEVKDIGD
jgi:osmotically-inducible protein OsmY